MARECKYDVVKLGKPRKTTNGFLEASAFLSRAGVFEYRNADGSVHRQLRLPEEIFRAESLETLRHSPLSRLHPKEGGTHVMLTPDNASKNMIGFVAGTPERAGNFIAGKVVVTDSRVIKEIEHGDLGELSCGYFSDDDNTPGVWNGQRYDSIQRNIVYNHVALVPRGLGRAGEQVALHLDAEEAPLIGDIQMDEKLKELQAKLDAKDAELKRLGEELKAATDKSKTNEMQGKLDAKDAEIKKLQEQLSANSDPQSIQKRVDERIRLITDAKTILGDDSQLTGSDTDIKKAVIAKALPNLKLDSADDNYISGVYQGVLESRKTEEFGDVRRHLDSLGQPDIDVVSLAYNEMVRSNQERWKA